MDVREIGFKVSPGGDWKEIREVIVSDEHIGMGSGTGFDATEHWEGPSRRGGSGFVHWPPPHCLYGTLCRAASGIGPEQRKRRGAKCRHE